MVCVKKVRGEIQLQEGPGEASDIQAAEAVIQILLEEQPWQRFLKNESATDITSASLTQSIQ
jgi:hypothetical protein